MLQQYMTAHLLDLQSNSARELGGAISIQPSISIQDRAALNVADDVFAIWDLFLDTVNMSVNTANQGGCMNVTGNGANVTAVNSYFDRYLLAVFIVCAPYNAQHRIYSNRNQRPFCSADDAAGVSCSESNAGTTTADASFVT